MQYIAESLFFVLDHSLPLSVPLTPKGTESRSTGTFSCVTSLAPALAGMFLDVLLSHSTNASEDLHRIQWTFWELAKVGRECLHDCVSVNAHVAVAYVPSLVYSASIRFNFTQRQIRKVS